MKRIMILCIAWGISGYAYSQLSGIKNIPGDFSTLAEAITALNTQGVGTGGVVINMLAGGSEIAPSGGYALTTLSSSAANPVLISGNGCLITASSSQVSGSLSDAVFKIIGSDYITLQGFVLQENAANTIISASTNTMTEFGIALFYASTTNGAKNITLENNTISLNRLYQNSFGIYSNVRHSATAPTAVADITSQAGANENTRIYANSISNVNQGIVIIGSAVAANMNTGIDIGGTSLTQGNTVANYGLTSSFSSFVSVTSGVMGVNLNNCLNSNVSYNTVNCPGLNTAGNVYGLYVQASGTIPLSGGPYTYTINYNSLSVKSGLSSGIVYGLYQSVGNAVFSYTISHNDFSNMGHSTASASGTVYCLYAAGGANSQVISYNTFSNLTLITSGTAYLLNYTNSLPLSTSTQEVTHNSTIGAIAKTGSGGTLYCAYSASASVNGCSKTLAFNNFSNLTAYGSTGFRGLYEFDGGSPVKSIHDNTISNVLIESGVLTGLNFDYGSANIFNNTFSNLTSGGLITGMSCGGSNTSMQNIYSNVITGIMMNSTSTATGIYTSASADGAVTNVYGNKICDVTGSAVSSSVNGIRIGAGPVVNVYNNMVSDLKTPVVSASNNLVGIYITGGTNVGVFFNSVYLSATSSGTNFGSSAFYSISSPVLTLMNNILVNTSVPKGTGITAAFRYSASTLTNYASTSNANCFYAGYPEDASHAVFVFSTTPYTFAGFQSLVGPTRDSYSFFELPPFISTTQPCGNLHLDGGAQSGCSDGGFSVTIPVNITTDFDGDLRQWAPDVGADEYWGPIYTLFPPIPFTATPLNSQQVSLSFVPDPSNDSVLIVWNTSGVFTNPAGPVPNVGSSFANGTLVFRGLNSPFLHTGLTGGVTNYYRAFSYSGLSFSGGVSANATTTVASPSSLSATAVSPTQVNLGYVLNPRGNEVIIATNSTSAFGNPVNGIALSAGDLLSGGGFILYKGSLTAFIHSDLNASTTYYYKLWSVDEFNYYSSTAVAANATTPCSPVDILPWMENFDYLITPALPSCWKKGNGDWGTTVNSNSSFDADAHSGVQFLRESYLASNEFIWSPGFALLPGHLYDFSFWWAGDTYAGWRGEVFMNTSQDSTGAMLLGGPFVEESTVTALTYSQTHNQFTVPAAGIYYFAICVNASATPWYLSFDDFRMEEVAPECPLPFALTANDITENSATISWSGIYSDYAIEYGPAGFIIGTGTRTNHVSNPFVLQGLEPATSYSYYVGSICFPGPFGTNWSGPASFTTLNTPAKTLNITCLLQGLYDGSGGLLKAQGSSGVEFPGSIADKVTVELHAATDGALVFSMAQVNLDTDGLISESLPGNYNGSYYIYLLHRNSVPTASALPISFSGNIISYDFTSSAGQAYGSNQMQMPGGQWALFGGDVNQDGIVDASDMIIVDNESTLFSGGYIPADVNGDGLIDSSDMILLDNNVSGFITAIMPF